MAASPLAGGKVQSKDQKRKSNPYLFPSFLSVICLSSGHKLEDLDHHNIRKKGEEFPHYSLLLINSVTYHFLKTEQSKLVPRPVHNIMHFIALHKSDIKQFTV